MSRLWVTWERQRRNGSTSSALNAKLVEINLDEPRFIRYIKSIILTIKAVLAENPSLLFVQNPSIVLSTLAVFIGKVSKIKIVIDAHNSGIRPLEGRSRFFNAWANWLIAQADLTIVTNQELCDYVESRKGRPALLPDPLPELAIPGELMELQGIKNILFICSWSEDEPYKEVISAARNIDSSVCIYVTGNWKKKAGELPQEIPENIILTGFISELEFDALLLSADIVMDLTTRKDCMLCGAYEGLAANKPLILSSSPVLEAYFNKACVYTENTADGIAEAISKAVADYNNMSKESSVFKLEVEKAWDGLKEQLEVELGEILRV